MITALVCLVGAGWVSSVETALLGVPEARVRAALERGQWGAGWLAYWVRRPGLILTTLNLLRTTLLVVGAMVLAVSAYGYPLDAAFVGQAAGAGLVAFFAGHLVPQALAKRFAGSWALYSMWWVRGATTVLYPIAQPLAGLARRLGRGAGFELSGGAFWTPWELEKVSSEARAEAFGRPSEDMISSILEFADTVIREIMVPRTEMVAIPEGSDPDSVWNTVNTARHSRMPVYAETMDNVVGILHVKDLVRSSRQGQEFDLRRVVRRTFYVPEVMKISELLREFQRRKTHMAIVVDEYGGTAGLVTLEDIIEEIVGEIHDEHDIDEKQFRRLADNRVIADGRVNLWDLAEALGATFPEDPGYETLGGFLTAQTGYLPEPGAVVNWKGFRFTIKEADERRVRTVEIESAAVSVAEALSEHA